MSGGHPYPIWGFRPILTWGNPPNGPGTSDWGTPPERDLRPETGVHQKGPETSDWGTLELAILHFDWNSGHDGFTKYVLKEIIPKLDGQRKSADKES